MKKKIYASQDWVEEKIKQSSLLKLEVLDITLPSIGYWRDIVYANGKFVAVADGMTAYSHNGLYWEHGTLLEGFNPFAITYGNDKFVTVGRNSDIAAYSEDGINWTQVSLPVSGYWSSMAYGGGKFVAVADTNYSTTAVYSEDGINWYTSTLPHYNKWASVCYGDGKFVAIAQHNPRNVAAYSEDGINWTQTTLPTGVWWYHVAYGNGKFIAVDNDSNGAAYSEDGITWEQTTMPVALDWNCVIYGNGKFVAVGDQNDTSYGIAAYSEDGITWKQTTMPIKAAWEAVTYGDDKFVALATNNIVAYSTDGINWKSTYSDIMKNDEVVTDDIIRLIVDNDGDRLATEEFVNKNTIPVTTTAQVGQLLSVKAVDENGKPTEWETIDLNDEIDLSGYATVEQLNEKANAIHTHDDAYDAKGSADIALETANAYTNGMFARKSQVQIITWEADD